MPLRFFPHSMDKKGPFLQLLLLIFAYLFWCQLCYGKTFACIKKLQVLNISKIILNFQPPCSCVPMPSQKLAIICSGGHSLEHLLSSLRQLQGWFGPVEIVRIEDTPLPMLYLDSLESLSSLSIRKLVLRNNSLSHLLMHPEASSIGPLLDSVEKLEIIQNEVTQFENCPALTAFRNLRSLSLAGNRLGRVPAHIFLQFLSRRSLQQFVFQYFQKNFCRLDLSSNWLSERSIPDEAFIGLESLMRLSLDKNQFSRVPTNAIAELADSLEELFLSANQIDQLEMSDLPPLLRLKSLGLDANQISWLAGEALRNVPTLWYLYLSQNQFPAIPPTMLAYVPDLKVLAIGGNPIDQIEAETFQLVPSLLRLELSNCRIRQIHPEAFSPMARLQFLHINGNRLGRVQSGLFAGKLPFLVSLDLAKNELEHVDDLAFAGLVQLQCRLDSFSENVFRDTFPKTSAHLQMLNLEVNPINCNEGKIGWIKQLMGRVRFQGSCEMPRTLKGKPLAELATPAADGDIIEIGKKTIHQNITDGNAVQKTVKNRISAEITMITTAASITPQTTTTNLGRNTTMKEGINITSGSCTIGTSSLPRGTMAPPISKAEQRKQSESNRAILILVVTLTVLGLTLLGCLLLASALLRRRRTHSIEESTSHVTGHNWLHMKMFSPSKCFEPHQRGCVAKGEATQAALLKTKSSNAVFYTDDRETGVPLANDDWHVRKEFYWF